MAKRRAGSRIASLTPDHKRSGIDLFSMSDSRVQHGVGKLLMRATTLLQTTLRSKVCLQSYGAPKSWESHSGVLGKIAIWMWAPWRVTEYTIRGKVVASPQVRAMVSLVCPCCPWLVLAPRVLQLCTNHFVWVVCKPV